MLLIYGRKKAKIKTHYDNTGRCTTCSAHDLKFEVYREYFHIFWIPFFPLGPKDTIVTCTKCGHGNNSSDRLDNYQATTNTPIYLFSGLLLVACLIIWITINTQNVSKQKSAFVASPQVGDIYCMRSEENSSMYYYLRVARMNTDSIFLYPNTYEYSRPVSILDKKDHFISFELYYDQAELNQLLNQGEINSVKREYNESSGYNRILKPEEDSVFLKMMLEDLQINY